MGKELCRDRAAESHVCPKTQSWKSKSAVPESKLNYFQDTEVCESGSWELSGAPASAP